MSLRPALLPALGVFAAAARHEAQRTRNLLQAAIPLP